MHECCMNTFTHMEDLCMYKYYNAAFNIYGISITCKRVVEIVHCKASFRPYSHVTSARADRRLCSHFNVCFFKTGMVKINEKRKRRQYM